MRMKKVFLKALSIAKCVLNAALAFALVLNLQGKGGLNVTT